jgi:hypothetical protein
VLPILASIVVYGALAYKERGINLVAASTDASASGHGVAGASVTGSTAGVEQIIGIRLTTAVFEWAYYVAVASVALCLVAAALLFCDSRRSADTTITEDGKGRYQQTTNVEVYSTDQ